MLYRKTAAFTAALILSLSAVQGIIFGTSAADTERFYNFSDLAGDEYAKNTEHSVFNSALILQSTEESIASLSMSETVTSPSGVSYSITNTRKSKRLSVKLHLSAGETVTEYYCGSNSGGTTAMAVEMAVKNASGTVLAAESNAENNRIMPYTISYTAAEDGDYTIIDSSSKTVRTIVYAVAVSPASIATAAPTTSPEITAPPSVVPPTAAPHSTGLSITKTTGWTESAYITWTNPAAVDSYNVYIRPEGGSYTNLDKELIRYYDTYYRADAVGLTSGRYQFKVEAVRSGAVSSTVESDIVSVSSYIREGFAFDSRSSYYNPNGIGAYKNDGSLKDGAQVIYITDNNKDNVKFNVITDTSKNTVTSCTGLCEILSSREKQKAETTPLAIRMIGMVTTPDKLSDSSLKYISIKSTENITFEGIGNDAIASGWSLHVRDTNNIEIRNLAVKDFVDDGISLDTDNNNDWVHNCDFFYGKNGGSDKQKGDGSLDIKSNSDYCSLSYNHFWDSGKSSLCGMKNESNCHVTYYGNWFDHSDSRHPRVRYYNVHVYNNYYDGNAKYGIGATCGSSIFVEKNVFRSCAHPVLTSMQGTDIANGKGTFSSEDGGAIKMFDNKITGGTDVKYSHSGSISSNTDAYLASTRDEQVPSTYTAKQGGAIYSNFDTESGMYSYTPLETDDVVRAVTTYSGRMEGGDLTFSFANSSDDGSSERNAALDTALSSYSSSLVREYVTETGSPSTVWDIDYGNIYTKADVDSASIGWLVTLTNKTEASADIHLIDAVITSGNVSKALSRTINIQADGAVLFGIIIQGLSDSNAQISVSVE